ncbi:alanine/ornithine racemase family PLP-dependent enzyme, partial [Clostridioides difficile]|nr:alanine/ornithine racemase family PLP-dependent enzyme [Clostridioides difficile]
MYPRLEIDIEKLKHNAKLISQMCHERNIKISFVTKSFCAQKEIVEEICSEGIDHIADSRIQNLKKLQDINLPKILIRIPMLSELEEVINYCDISFNSELGTIKKLNE